VATVNAALPELERGVYLTNGAAPLQVETMSLPAVADWNNDGKKDLLVGQFTLGKIWVFLNRGTDASPVFNGGTLVQSGGTAISTSYG